MEYLIERFENDECKNIRVIAPCLRGFGYSTYYEKIDSLRDYAKDLKLFVEEFLGN